MLSVEDGEELALWVSYREHGALIARERLFALYAAFARSIARRHYRERTCGDLELADLEQLAFSGLLEAIDRYDPSRETAFRHFAGARISGSVIDGLNKMTEVREQLSWKHRIRKERIQSLGPSKTEDMGAGDALAALADLALGLALGFLLEGTALYVDAAQEETRSTPLPSAYDSLAWKEMVNRLMDELSALPERDQTILRYHYLEGVSFGKLANLFGLSKGRISQLHRAALAQLRLKMANKGHFRLGEQEWR